MSGNLRLNGKTSGYSQLAAPDAAGDQTFTFPTKGGTLAIASNNTAGAPVPGYQQGQWTPTFAQSDDSSVRATNYSNRVGHWTRIGNRVTCSFTLNMADSTGIGNLNQDLVIIDFPYKSIKFGTYYGSSSSVHANGWTVGQVVFCNILLGQDTTVSNTIYYARSDKNGTYTLVNYNTIGTGSLIGEISYLTDNTDWAPINGATVDS